MENIVSEPAVKLNWVSPNDYLAAERLATEKHEYFEGEVVIMQGACLKNLRTASPSFLSFTYPDATIMCGDGQLSDDNFDVLQNPVVIFEVVSRSSVASDYVRKWIYYRQIPSLKEYVLINSFEKMQLEIYRRNPDNNWTFQSHNQPEELLQLQSVGIAISLKDIYENVTFGPLQEEAGVI